MRKLSDNFIKKLQGEWKPLLEYILSDSELDLQIRDNYINVYYQGGNILKINPRSFYFDEFYFYKDCNKERKTHLQEKAKKGDVNAKQIIDDLVKERDDLKENLKSPLNHSKVECYFSKAKAKMKKWEETLNATINISHKEKQEQQQIVIANRNDTDYVVLDLEYEVSTDSEFKYDGIVKGKARPRFDIIAIHNSQIIVIELKKGLGAIEGKSGIKDHIDSYMHTIGRDYKKLFVADMRELLKQKQDLGILDKSIIINNEKPKFVFAFADEEGKDEFYPFVKKCCEQGYSGEFIKIDPMTHILKQVNIEKPFPCKERERQLRLLQNEHLNQTIFGGASGNGWMYVEIKKQNKKEWRQYPHILQHQDSMKNLYKGIGNDAISYFKRNNILWWREDEDRYFPTGHLVSSQIHCLNHLFALRKDDVAIKAIIEKAIGLKIKKVYSSSIDKYSSFISFEFICKNKTLLHENYETRGANCTSVDALVYVQTIDNKNILIPIEWKYTETYQGKEANKESLDRYPKLIDSASNLKKWDDLYKADPYYELMRQTLLMEQIIKQKDINGIKAVDFRHIMVIPNAHTELKNAIEEKYIPTLKDKSKFIIIDPQDLLSPLKGNDDYKELLNYLETRYWK